MGSRAIYFYKALSAAADEREVYMAAADNWVRMLYTTHTGAATGLPCLAAGLMHLKALHWLNWVFFNMSYSINYVICCIMTFGSVECWKKRRATCILITFEALMNNMHYGRQIWPNWPLNWLACWHVGRWAQCVMNAKTDRKQDNHNVVDHITAQEVIWEYDHERIMEEEKRRLSQRSRKKKVPKWETRAHNDVSSTHSWKKYNNVQQMNVQNSVHTQSTQDTQV